MPCRSNFLPPSEAPPRPTPFIFAGPPIGGSFVAYGRVGDG